MKQIFVIDWLLIPVFAVTSYSGFALHHAGHNASHEVWHNWAVCHVVASLLFIIIGILHVKNHWGWYKSLFSKGIGKKSRITLFLSAIFAVTIISGIILLTCVEGANSRIGLWHYIIGIVLTTFSLLHIIKRFNVLKKSLVKKNG